MNGHKPEIRTMNAAEARQQWSQVLDTVFRGEAQVIVEKSGIPVAAIISAEDLERFKRLDAERRKRFDVLDQVGAAFRDVAQEEIEQEVAKAVSEVRIENSRRRKHTATAS